LNVQTQTYDTCQLLIFSATDGYVQAATPIFNTQWITIKFVVLIHT